ncbi:MAG: ROK family protein [Proteobacteria bacterium]|nr:ROK family protein [Pseudomonadota bacterium]
MRIGIDLGGSKIEGLVLGPDGRELVRHRTDTPQGEYDATIAAVADLVARLAADAGAADDTPVGVGIPGTISPVTELIKNANSTCLIGHPLDKDLTAALGRPVRLANDADCFTMSEATDGAGKYFHTVFGAILGTGCGGGIAVGGNLLAGPNAISGEWGHNPMPWPQLIDGIDERPGPACYCGQNGCIETFLSGPGLERDFETATSKSLTAKEIAASTGTDAEAALSRYEHRLARALTSIINILDPNVIVLGGGLSNISRLYDSVPKIWNQWVFSDTVTTELKPARHGDTSGVRGAAWLW